MPPAKRAGPWLRCARVHAGAGGTSHIAGNGTSPPTHRSGPRAAGGRVPELPRPSPAPQVEAKRERKQKYARLARERAAGGPGEGADDDGRPAYKDRAEMRRRGVDEEYAGVDGELLDSVYAIDDSLSEEEKRRRRIEATRYLGGDLQHTHLVKGLDFALLRKVQEEMRSREEAEAQAAEVPPFPRAPRLSPRRLPHSRRDRP